MFTFTFVLGHINSGHMIDYTIIAADYDVAIFFLQEEYPESEYSILGYNQK